MGHAEPRRWAVALHGHEDGLWALAISPDGRRLVTGGSDNTARVWTLDANELVGLACQMAGRNLTQAEWVQYFGEEPYHITCEQWPAGQ